MSGLAINNDLKLGGGAQLLVYLSPQYVMMNQKPITLIINRG